MDIVLLGHGSRRGKDTDIGLQEVVRRLYCRLGNGSKVRMAGFEFTQPTLKEAIMGLAEEGSSKIIVLPFFLFEGKHIKLEIPEQLEQLQPLIPGASLVYARPLGVDSRLMQIVVERVDSATNSGTEKNHKSKGIVLVVRGSRPLYDSGENLYKLVTGMVDVYGGKVRVEPAQAQFGFPTIEAAIASVVRQNVEVVVVVPYLLFPGKVLYDNIQPAVERAKESYPHIQFRLAKTLGVDDRMIDIALDRLREVGVVC